MKTILKGLAVALYAAIGVFIQQFGLPTTNDGWVILSITVVGAALVYFAQRASGLFSTSNVLLVELRDFISAGIVAGVTAVTNFVATLSLTDKIDIKAILLLFGTTFLSVLLHKFGITNTVKTTSLASESDESDSDDPGRIGGGTGTRPK